MDRLGCKRRSERLHGMNSKHVIAKKKAGMNANKDYIIDQPIFTSLLLPDALTCVGTSLQPADYDITTVGLLAIDS